ncbi:MAG TPA: PP2C family protein-serine/threonine phosphatase, partial [Coriobacteriia bacterium]
DFYDLFELDNGLVGVTVGDISGKGLSAAALTSLVKNSIRARAVEKGTTPCDAVALADRVLYKGSAPEMFATVFFALLDRRDGRLVYCNAGHTAGVIAQPDGAALRLPANSPIAGALEGVAFRNSETRLEFGDALFLYTDGLVEARPGPGGELFGEDRLLEALSRRAVARETDLVEGVLGEVLEYSGGRLRDDVAVLEVRRTGDDSSAGTQTKLDLT